MPEHGAERNFRQETTHGENVELLDGETGEVVYRGPMVSDTQPVGERFCSHCGEWQAQRGILASVFGCPDCGADW